MIELVDARVVRGGRVVLDGATAGVAGGELVAVLGPNGSGKSTLVGALAGEHRLAGGAALADGRPLSTWSPDALARRRAVLRQASTFDARFTVEEVVGFGRTPWRDTAEVRDRTVAAAMADADVTHLATRVYTELSGGERQRVQFARVLAQLGETGTLLLDEPVAHLDPRHQLGVLETSQRRARAGAGVLVVLHDPNLALQCADRVLVLDAGRIVAHGAPGATLTPALMAAVFGVRVLACAGPYPDRPILVPAPAPGASRAASSALEPALGA